MSSIVFLAGIHGVGKGTFARNLSNQLGLSHFSASDLIKAQKLAPVDEQKTVIDPDENQSHLLEAVKRIETAHQHYLLDGHFTLWQNQATFEIPISVFEELPISGIVLLTEQPSLIASRLMNRDGTSWDENLIQQRQAEEVSRANYVRSSLKTPMLTIQSSQYESAIEWIRDLVSGDKK